MSIQTAEFGTTKNGEQADLYTLTNSKGTIAKVSNFGALLVQLHTLDKNGKSEDIVLGYDTLTPYEKNAPGFGATIGRNGNRIGNAEFTLNGTKYTLEKNDGKHNLHSGTHGYQRRMWKTDEVNETENKVTFLLNSPDGDQGFPGNLTVKVSYTLTEENELILTYESKTDQDTIVNMTNHTYFNLAGQQTGSVLGQKVWIDSDQVTDVDGDLIPDGRFLDITGTPLDFNKMKEIGKEIGDSYEPLVLANGFDHNWILKTKKGTLSLVAKMEDECSGRGMEVYADLPGMQFYSANFLDGTEVGKGGTVYGQRSGACFETQYYPNSMNIPEFPSCILKAGEEGSTKTVYKFYTI